jgi:Skp family chaperone for outer membrane proteins
MSPFRFAKFTAIAAMAFCGLAAAAHAQSVLVVDVNRAVTESQVGQYIQTQVTQIGQTIQNELQATAGSLDTDLQRFQAEASALTPEALQQNTDMVSRQTDLQNRLAAFETQQQQAQLDMQATEQQALTPVITALEEILEALRAERSAAMIINSAAVVVVDPNSDVTNDVIARLNQRMTTTAVSRVNTATAAPAQ